MCVVGQFGHFSRSVYESGHEVRAFPVVQAHRLVALAVYVDDEPSSLVMDEHFPAAVWIGDAGELSLPVIAVARHSAFGVCGAVRLHVVRVAVACLVAQRVYLRRHELFGCVAVGGRPTRGVGHQVVALFGMVLYASLHHSVPAVGMHAASLSVVLPIVGVAVAVGLLRHQVSGVRHPCGLSQGVGDAGHVSLFVVGVRHQGLVSFFRHEREFRYPPLSVRGGLYPASCRVGQSCQPSVCKVQPYPEAVRVLYVCQPPCPAVPHVKHVSEQGVVAVCLIAFFRAAQRGAFGAHVEFSARCYLREGHGTSVLHAQHRHAFVLEALHRAVVPAVCPVSEPSLIIRVGIPRPRPFQR